VPDLTINRPNLRYSDIDSNTVICYPSGVKSNYSLEELAQQVQQWCDEHKVQPANGQVAEAVSERTIRYYRTLGLLDAAPGAYLRSFTEKHRLQLLAIRIYQSQGIPLRRIHEQLYGKSEAQLREFVAKAGDQLSEMPAPFEAAAPVERWGVVSLTDDLLLVSRQGRSLPASVIRRLQAALAEAGWPGASETKRN
jgi:DNA-binding transcriptional MerR regulator